MTRPTMLFRVSPAPGDTWILNVTHGSVSDPRNASV